MKIMADYNYFRVFKNLDNALCMGRSACVDTIKKLGYGFIMFRIIEYIIAEGRYSEFLEAVQSTGDMFECIRGKPLATKLQQVIAHLNNLMIAGPGKCDIDAILVNWVNSIVGSEKEQCVPLIVVSAHNWVDFGGVLRRDPVRLLQHLE